jgi:hypothetical protein
MDALFSPETTKVLYTLLALMGIAVAMAVLLLVWVIWRVKRINLPAGADFFTALEFTPFVVVVILDLLDFGLDFLSVPIAWTLLSRLGLGPLRGVTILEELIPGTQFLPTMTVAWILVRFVGWRRRLR